MYEININPNIAIILLIVCLCVFAMVGFTIILYLIVKMTKPTEKKIEPEPPARIDQMNPNLHLGELSFQDATGIVNNIIAHRVRSLVRRQDLGKYDSDTLSVMIDDLTLQLCTEVDTSINDPLRVRLLMFVSDEFLTYYIHDTVQSILVLSIAEARNNKSSSISSSRKSALKTPSRVKGSKGLASGRSAPSTKGTYTPKTPRDQTGIRILQ